MEQLHRFTRPLFNFTDSGLHRFEQVLDHLSLSKKNIHVSPPGSGADSLDFSAFSGKIQAHQNALSGAGEIRWTTSGWLTPKYPG